jgi:hypothetical protein
MKPNDITLSDLEEIREMFENDRRLLDNEDWKNTR